MFSIFLKKVSAHYNLESLFLSKNGAVDCNYQGALRGSNITSWVRPIGVSARINECLVKVNVDKYYSLAFQK